MLIIANASQPLTRDQRRMLTASLRGALADAGVRGAVLVGDGSVPLAAVQPYSYREELGDYAYTWGFPTEREMAIFRCKMAGTGLWYDWDLNESNDPRWAELSVRPRCVDKATGEAIPRVIFYHAGTKAVCRIATQPDGHVEIWPHSSTPLIWETRELEICVAPAKA